MNLLAKLCYISGPWAYFTTRPLTDQWGDDWNDAPYEHNAGEPYLPRPEEETPWEIIKVAWEGSFDTPCADTSNSPWSVEQINAGVVAWLRPQRWTKHKTAIFAGATLQDFIKLITTQGGVVYLPVGLLEE